MIKIDVKELSITTQKGDYQFAHLDNLLQSLVLKMENDTDLKDLDILIIRF